MIIISNAERPADSQAYKKAVPQLGGVRTKCSITIGFSPGARSNYCDREPHCENTAICQAKPWPFISQYDD